MEGEKNNYFIVENPDNAVLNQVIKVNINCDKSYLHIISLTCCDKNGTLPLWSSSQSNYEKNIRHIPVKGHSTKYLTSVLQNSQGHQKQGNSEKKSQTRRAHRDTITNVL